MTDGAGSPLGYAFALPRLVLRLTGRAVRRAEFSGLEAYGMSILVFGISWVWAGRALFPLVSPVFLRWFVLVLLPIGIWAAFLILYYLVSLVIALCRRLGVLAAVRNTSFQHVVIMLLTTLFAWQLVSDPSAWVKSLGMLWLALLALNLLAKVGLKVLKAE